MADQSRLRRSPFVQVHSRENNTFQQQLSQVPGTRRSRIFRPRHDVDVAETTVCGAEWRGAAPCHSCTAREYKAIVEERGSFLDANSTPSLQRSQHAGCVILTFGAAAYGLYPYSTLSSLCWLQISFLEMRTQHVKPSAPVHNAVILDDESIWRHNEVLLYLILSCNWTKRNSERS